MFAACRDAGINFFDCANVYSDGAAETILGKLIKGTRDELVITSKCFGPMGGDINARGASRRNILHSVEESLKRLGTDRLDVLFMHHWDATVPLEETLRALERLVADGKVPLSRRQQLRRLADCQWARDFGKAGLAAVRCAAADVFAGQAAGRGRDLSAGARRGARRDQLFGGCCRAPERQVRQGPAARGGACRQQRQVRDPLQRGVVHRHGGSVHRPGGRARRAPGVAGGRLGRRPSGCHQPDLRGAQCRAAAAVAGLYQCRDDARASCPDRSPVADPAAGDGPAGRSRSGRSDPGRGPHRSRSDAGVFIKEPDQGGSGSCPVCPGSAKP